MWTTLFIGTDNGKAEEGISSANAKGEENRAELTLEVASGDREIQINPETDEVQFMADQVEFIGRYDRIFLGFRIPTWIYWSMSSFWLNSRPWRGLCYHERC